MRKKLGQIEDGFCAAVLLIMTVLTVLNVVARYLFKASMPFVEELTCLGLVILSLMGAAVAAKRGAHLGLSVITDLSPEHVQKKLRTLACLIGVILGLIILYFGFLMTKQEFDLKQLTAGMQWPEWLYGMFVPISGVFLVIRYSGLVVRTLKEKKKEEGDIQ